MAQTGVAGLAADPSVRRALDFARSTEQDTVREQIRLCEIPAPPFGEAMRAAAYAQSMRAAGLTNVRIDSVGNVLGERPGRTRRPHLVLSAHLDTVFPADVPVSVTRDKNWLRGPGIADDCRGLAVVLAVARALEAAKVQTEGPITFVGTVGEEGLGDLRGVKALYASTLREQSHRFVSVDGDGYAITNVGIGSRRYRVTFRGPGGHSYDDFGRANPVNAVGLAIARVSRLEVPVAPRTTFSVGRIGGGTSINSIASEAWMEVDLRSADEAALKQLDAAFQASVRAALEEENGRRKSHDALTVAIESVGNRPAGRTDPASTVVETAMATLRALGLPVRLDERSTDANLPMSVGISSIAIGGGGVGRDAHSPRESFDTSESWRGTQLVTLLAVALAR
jgi:acetylornithine deacetylase/succinyl-diaminopimelate desuccinylase-like protein